MAVPPRLVERFGRSPLAVVTAPAGFGKTTLLESWWDRSGDTPKTLVSFDTFRRPNALDAGHAHVRGLTAIGLSPSVADELVALVPPDAKSFGDAFVDAVVNELRALPNEFVLFFDDVHGLVPEAERDLGRIVAMVATDVHRVVVASRREPPWPIHRWKMSGLVDVIAADDLRLTADEVAEMLGPEMAAFAIRVATATGGWAAAVEAVRWRLQVDPSVEVERAVLDLVGYVCAEVLPALDPPDVQVLARTAILEPFPASVAVAVTADDRAPRVLEQTALRTSLVTRFDDGRYAYHPVLREALRRQLTESEPDIERELHGRAADAWLDEADSFAGLASAIDHHLEARSWERAVELLRKRWAEVDTQSRFDLFVQWLDAIPGRIWRNDVELMLLYGWANLRIGRAPRALEGLQDPTIAQNPHAAALAKVAYAWTVAWSTDPVEAVKLVGEARPVLSDLDEANPRLRDIPGVMPSPRAMMYTNTPSDNER